MGTSVAHPEAVASARTDLPIAAVLCRVTGPKAGAYEIAPCLEMSGSSSESNHTYQRTFEAKPLVTQPVMT